MSRFITSSSIFPFVSGVNARLEIADELAKFDLTGSPNLDNSFFTIAIPRNGFPARFDSMETRRNRIRVYSVRREAVNSTCLLVFFCFFLNKILLKFHMTKGGRVLDDGAMIEMRMSELH